MPASKMKTKVEKYGAFWCVFRLSFNTWQRMRDLYPTRREAEAGRAYWASY
jgi:hypothetical protein